MIWYYILEIKIMASFTPSFELDLCEQTTAFPEQHEYYPYEWINYFQIWIGKYSATRYLEEQASKQAQKSDTDV